MLYKPSLLCHCLSLGLLLSTASVFAQNPAPCSTPEYRQFDFWVGEWQVTFVNADGERQLAGRNTIKPIYNGCALHEQWRGASSSQGESFNIYDASRGVWHQTWVDNSGTLLNIEGGLQDGAMVLTGSGPAVGGGDGEVRTAEHRISWQPNEDGTVTQTWTTRTGGGDWQTLFQGRYERKVKAN